jgi:hypothetical protein
VQAVRGMKTITIELCNNGVMVLRYVPEGRAALDSYGYQAKELDTMLGAVRALIAPKPEPVALKPMSRARKLFGAG